MRRGALAGVLLFGACFEGHALWGERCAVDGACGPGLLCQEDGVCAEAPACEQLELAAQDLRPRVVLLLDHSLSMERCLDGEALSVCAAPGGPGPNRWDGLGSLVSAVVEQVGDEVTFAAVEFPSYNPELQPQFQCLLDASTSIAFGPQASQAIVARVMPDPARLLRGENPVREAWQLAREMIEASIGAAIPPRRIVLITDNPPNCPAGATGLQASTENIDPALTGLVEEGAAAGIATIVVGITIKQEGDLDVVIGGTDPHVYLSTLALAGGAPQPGETPYLHLADSTVLADVADALAAELAGLGDEGEACRVHLVEPPADPELVAVGLAGRLRREDADCADAQGWRWADASRQTLELCPQMCADMRAGARVRVRVDCR